jgi:hypothetical protein
MARLRALVGKIMKSLETQSEMRARRRTNDRSDERVCVQRKEGGARLCHEWLRDRGARASARSLAVLVRPAVDKMPLLVSVAEPAEESAWQTAQKNF